MQPLETQWKEYKRKKRKPFIFLTLTLALIAGIGLTLNENKVTLASVSSYIQKMLPSSVASIGIDSETIENNLFVTKAFTQIDTKSQEGKSETSSILVDIPILDMENNIVLEKSTKKETVQLNIIGTSSAIAYEDVEERFNQNHDIDDALFLAKSYYKKGDYKKSAYWALETNKLDDNIEESIFIFVESKVKSGK
ncbi:MAG: hypothetical protein Q9M36_16040 [Sulfurovum sp.]|nr:hypothetical protein [Sulfurovum sp.]